MFVVAFGLALAVALGRLGVEVVGDARAELAADAAALAAADELVLGGGPNNARLAATRAAAANGAELAACDCDDSPVTVVVHLDAGPGTVLEARARAEIEDEATVVR